MKNYYKYILFLVGTIIIGVAIWYFWNIVTYVLISAVLSLIGAPFVFFLGKLRIGKMFLPKGLCAGLTLILFWVLFIAFFRVFVPLVAVEAQKFSTINYKSLLTNLNEPMTKIDTLINTLNINKGTKFSTFDLLNQKIESILNIGLFTDIFSSLANTIGNIFIALFSISFITFFFLKDERLFGEAIILLVPTNYEEATSRVLNSTKNLLMRYFVGICGQISGIIILVTVGLFIVGIDFRTCLVISFFAGIINVIPYIGPLIGSIFGLVVGMASKINILTPEQLLPLFLYIILVYIIVHLIDNILFQPLIFSSSVKAHPLEIFLVILIAGHIAGITGMLIAIPSYTVIRVFAKQFLNNFKVVKKLTEKI
jgi:predicted PurR-regulated permease PerM